MVTYRKSGDNAFIRITDNSYLMIDTYANDIRGQERMFSLVSHKEFDSFYEKESDATEFLLALQTVLNNRQNLVTEIENEIINENASTN